MFIYICMCIHMYYIYICTMYVHIYIYIYNACVYIHIYIYMPQNNNRNNHGWIYNYTPSLSIAVSGDQQCWRQERWLAQAHQHGASYQASAKVEYIFPLLYAKGPRDKKKWAGKYPSKSLANHSVSQHLNMDIENKHLQNVKYFWIHTNVVVLIKVSW